MRALYRLLVLCAMMYVSCAGNPHPGMEFQSPSESPGERTFMEIYDTLAAGGNEIDYDTLMRVYKALSQSRYEIPHVDHLLGSLMDKRNDNRRVDEMILIFTAKSMGGSKYPIPHIDALFERLLSKDDRLSQWVLAFVAEAIENYPVELHDGERLVDLLEEKLAMVRFAPGPHEAYFGYHFLPPPKSNYIRSYIAGIKEQSLRERERRHYYLLIVNGYSESKIEKALKQLHNDPTASSEAHATGGMTYLFLNRLNIP